MSGQVVGHSTTKVMCKVQLHCLNSGERAGDVPASEPARYAGMWPQN